MIKISCLNIIKILVWMIEESKNDRDKLKCFELRKMSESCLNDTINEDQNW